MLEVVSITGTAAQIYSELVKAEQLSVAEVAERRMRQLMTDLGVTSRFQADVAACEKGRL